MKRLIIFLGIFLVFFCKAQQNYPLLISVDSVPNLAHLKDTNNELQAFVGTYTANYNGNQIILFITKENDKFFDYGNKQVYIDILYVRYTVKDSSNNVLQSTQNIPFQSDKLNTIFSLWTAENGSKLLLNYTGTNCSVGWGDIYLKKINATQISWEYRPEDITTTAAKCPSTLDTTIYLPETKDLIFTKQ